jgi:Xaa-Pro dipeptidase
MRRRKFLIAALSGSVFASCGPVETPVSFLDQPTGPLDELESLTRDLQPIPETEFGRRLDLLLGLLREDDVGTFFTEAGSSLEYFTGIRWGRSERLFGAVFGRDVRPTLIAPAFEEERVRQQVRVEADVLTWREYEDPYRLVRRALDDAGVRSGSVAVEPTTRLFVLSGLRGACPEVEFLDGRRYSERCRIRKSPVEIESMRLANEITKRAYAAALSDLWEGLEEGDLAATVAEAHARLGAQGGALVLFGPNSALPHGSIRGRQLRLGDVVLMDGGCNVRGYRSDVTRSVVFGQPSGLQETVWDIVYSAQSAAIEAARPGVTCGDLDAVARRIIEEAGYGPEYEFFTHRLGHGIGLDGHEPPYIVQGNPAKLESGMTFSIEPGIYLDGQWGIRHEDIVVITEDGAEVLGERAAAQGYSLT